VTEPIYGWKRDTAGTYMYDGKGVITYERTRHGAMQEIDFDGADLTVSEDVTGYGGYRATIGIPLELLRELLAFHGYKIVNSDDEPTCNHF
jgi:hypothetical protein